MGSHAGAWEPEYVNLEGKKPMKILKRTAFAAGIAVALSGSVYADLDDGLIAHYPFDGNGFDISGHGRHAEEHGDITYISRTNGDQAVQLGGNLDNFLTVAHEEALNFSGSFTISVWAYRLGDPEYASHVDSILVGKGRDCLNSYQISFNGQRFHTKTDGPCSDWSSRSLNYYPVPQKEWHLLTAIFDQQEGKIKYYMDAGMKSEAFAIGYKPTNDFPLVIGKLFGDPDGNVSAYAAMANLDDLRLYDRALLPSEVDALYNLKAPPPAPIATPPDLSNVGQLVETGLVAYYPLDNDARDKSGNERHGVAHGAIEYVQGVAGQAANFNGDLNKYIRVAHEEAFNFKDSFTLSLWLYRRGDPKYVTNVDSMVVGKGRDCFNNYLISRNATTFKVKIDGGCSEWGRTRPVSTSVPLEEWHLVTGIFDKPTETLKYYLDGELQGEINAVGYQPTNDFPFVIGKMFADAEGALTAYPAVAVVDEVRLYNRALLACEISSLSTGKDMCAYPLYAVHDAGRNNSQLLTIFPPFNKANALGEIKPAHDLEALDMHPKTCKLYAASGRDTANPGHIYIVNKQTGEVTDNGATGFLEIDGISFKPDDGTLWGWAQDVGLIKINPETGESQLILEYPGEIEDLTWNTAGTILYGVENLHKRGDGGVLLWAYNITDNTVQTVCDELTSTREIEALETLSDDQLIFGIHGQKSLPVVGVIDLSQCKITITKEINTGYNDIEGIALDDCAK